MQQPAFLLVEQPPPLLHSCQSRPSGRELSSHILPPPLSRAGEMSAMEQLRFLTPEKALQVREGFGSPCYVYDEASLRENAAKATAFPNAYGASPPLPRRRRTTGQPRRCRPGLRLAPCCRSPVCVSGRPPRRAPRALRDESLAERSHPEDLLSGGAPQYTQRSRRGAPRPPGRSAVGSFVGI
jgi:hypothetical protein